MPLVLHGQAEVTPPLITILVFFIDDTRTRMDKLEQLFRQMRIFNGVTNWDDLMYVHLIRPYHKSMILMFDDHDLDERY